MGLYKRKQNSNKWYMAFTVDGVPYNESTGTDDEKTAKEIWRRLEAKIALKQWHPELLEKRKKEYTFMELAEKYQGYKKPRLKSEKAIANEASTIKMLKAALSENQLNQTTTEALEKLQSDMLEAGNLPGTVNRKFDILRNMFTKASDWDMVSEETMKRIKKVKHLKMENMRLRFLTKEECRALVEACDPHLRPVVITALNTGMRLGEILNLEWDRHIDLKHGFILLDKTKNSNRREIPINSTLRTALQSVTRRLDITYVFFNPAIGKPYGHVKKSFATAKKNAEVEKCTKCDYQRAKDKTQPTIQYCPLCNSEMAVHKGISDFRFHDTRHTFASHLVMAGVDITTVSKLLGHKSLTMTLRYAHLAPSHMVKAVNILDSALNGKTPVSGQKNEADYCSFTVATSNQPLAVNETY